MHKSREEAWLRLSGEAREEEELRRKKLQLIWDGKRGRKKKKREEEAMKKPIFANRLEILFIIYILRCRMGRRISFKSWDESSLKKKKLVKTGLSLSKENFHVGIWVINFIIFLLILPGPNLVFFFYSTINYILPDSTQYLPAFHDDEVTKFFFLLSVDRFNILVSINPL